MAMQLQNERVPALGFDDPADGSEQDRIETWLAALQAIDDALGRTRNVVRVPCRIMLQSLPPTLRGSRWGAGPVPEAVVELEPWELLDKIRAGRVTYPLRRLRPDLPEGWVSEKGEAELELDVAELRTVLPPHLAARIG